MALFILLTCLWADPAAEPNFADYFKRQDEQKAKAIAELEKKIGELKAAIDGETNRGRQGALRGEMNRTEKQLDSVRKQTYQPRISWPYASLNQVGLLPDGSVNAKVVAIVDDTTAIIQLHHASARVNVVLTKIDAKQLKLRQPFSSDQAWHVTAAPVTDDELLKILKSENRFDSLKPSPHHYSVAPVSEKDLKRERIAYDAQKE